MNLNEILDSKANVKWKKTEDGWSGLFTFDEKDFEIIIDEYDLTLPTKIYSVLDFGFKVDGSWKVTNENRNSSKIIGVVLNAFVIKMNLLKPDCVIFGVNYINGSIESRKSLYSRIAHLYSKGSSFAWTSDWIKAKKGEYKIMSKNKFSDEELEVVKDLALNTFMKPID